MSLDAKIKVHKDAFISSVFSLTKAAQDASNSLIDLINTLQGTGTLTHSDVLNLKAAAAPAVSAAVAASTAAASLPDTLATEQSARTPAARGRPSLSSAAPAAQHGSYDAQDSLALREELVKARRKRAKKIPDPNAPKRPLPPYLIFSNEQKKIIRDQREKVGEKNLPMNELNLIVQERWAQLPQTEKDNIQEVYQSEIQEWHRLNERYKRVKGDLDLGTEDTPEAADGLDDASVSSSLASRPAPVPIASAPPRTAASPPDSSSQVSVARSSQGAPTEDYDGEFDHGEAGERRKKKKDGSSPEKKKRRRKYTLEAE